MKVLDHSSHLHSESMYARAHISEREHNWGESMYMSGCLWACTVKENIIEMKHENIIEVKHLHSESMYARARYYISEREHKKWKRTQLRWKIYIVPDSTYRYQWDCERDCEFILLGNMTPDTGQTSSLRIYGKTPRIGALDKWRQSIK